MHLLLYFSRAYPRRTLVMLVCLLLSALAEGLGLSSLLPLLSLAAKASGEAHLLGGGQSASSSFEQTIAMTLAWFGLTPSVGLLLILIVCGMTLKAVLLLLAQKQIGYTVAQVATDLRLKLLRALLAARWEYYVRQPVGALANSFGTEVSRAAHGYQCGATICTLGIQAFVYLSIAAVMSIPVMLAATVASIVISFSLKRFVRQSRKAGRQQSALLKTLLSQLTDMLFSVKPIKAMARESLIGPLLEEDTRRLHKALRREILSKETLKSFQEPLVIGLLVGGLYLAVIHGGVPLDALILLAVLFERTLTGFNKIQKEYQAMASYEAAFWSLQNTIERSAEHKEVSVGTAHPVLSREVALRNVDFAYGDRPVLQQASLSIPVGKVTIILGPSGAGKTSLLDLIVGLLRPQQGEVWIDDLPLRAVDMQSWRSMIGYVTQETFLLHESVFLNVTLGDQTVTPTEVEMALRAAGAWDFVSAMPDGMYTPVGERGSAISGGQRQRIAIARALVRQPKLLILDEATAALDPESEAEIRETVTRMSGSMTILVISHRSSLITVADRIYRLEDGHVRLADVVAPRIQEHRDEAL